MTKIIQVLTNEEKTNFLACDNFEKFQIFIDNYEISKFDNLGNTILHYYLKNLQSFKLDAKKVIREMIKRGLDINAQSAKGTHRHTPLNIAVQQKLKDIFDILIELGADVNVTVGNGNSVLSNAIMWSKGDGYFIQKLIQNRANVYQKNEHGVSPISLAYHISNYDFKTYFAGFEYTPG